MVDLVSSITLRQAMDEQKIRQSMRDKREQMLRTMYPHMFRPPGPVVKEAIPGGPDPWPGTLRTFELPSMFLNGNGYAKDAWERGQAQPLSASQCRRAQSMRPGIGGRPLSAGRQHVFVAPPRVPSRGGSAVEEGASEQKTRPQTARDSAAGSTPRRRPQSAQNSGGGSNVSVPISVQKAKAPVPPPVRRKASNNSTVSAGTGSLPPSEVGSNRSSLYADSMARSMLRAMNA